MCFGSKSTPAVTPAPAPPPPDPIAEEVPPTEARRVEEDATFGTAGQTTRVDRSATSGGVAAGGAGLRM